MKNYIEKIKDFLYDATDYLLILAIIVGVVVVIGWRLDILFAKDMDKLDTNNDKAPVTDVVKNEKDNTDEENDNVVDNTDEGTNDNDDNKIDENIDDNNSDNDSNTNTDVKPDTEEMITVKIPSGSLPPTIANILLEKGLIDNKMDFLIKSQELKLDTKLKSGEFNIKKGTSLEEVIRMLAK